MGNVVIVDTGLCNLDSIARAVEECGGGPPVVTDDPRLLSGASRVILPGVGAFPEAMSRLTTSGLADAMSEQVRDRGIPFLGICLGMQLLATTGHEISETPGLGWIQGEVRPLRAAPGERVPHIGWNQLRRVGSSPLLEGIDDGRDFYFVHSFVLEPDDVEVVVGTTPYGGDFVSAVARDNIYGVQFHPEKSQRAGFTVLSNFLSI